VGVGVRAGDAQGCLTRMPKALGNAGQEQRPAGDRLEMFCRVGAPHKQVPPVVDKSDKSRGKSAPGEIVRCEPAPSPLVLQFIKRVLAIRPVPIELAKGGDLAVERGYQGRVLVDLALVDLSSRQHVFSLVGRNHQ
jgi:hypothetical protein